MSRVAFSGLAIQAAASAQGVPLIATAPSNPIGDDPGEKGRRAGEGHHAPARAIDAGQIEAATRVPPKVPDAIGEVVEEGDGPAEKEQAAEDRADSRSESHVGLRPRSR